MSKPTRNSVIHAFLLSIITVLTAGLFVLDARLRRARRLFRDYMRHGGDGV